jgi:hypothetical protein
LFLKPSWLHKPVSLACSQESWPIIIE